MRRPPRTRRAPALVISAVAATSCTTAARGQVDASWIGPSVFTREPIYAAQPGPTLVLNQGWNWTDPVNWSTLAFPANDGSALIGAPGLVDPIDRQSRIVITLDADVSLRDVVFSNPGGVDISDTQPALNARLIAAPAGLTLRGEGPIGDAPSRAYVVSEHNNLHVPIAGNGSVAIVGTNLVTLGKPNSFTGPMHIAGVLALTNRSGDFNYDARFGQSGQTTLDGGTLRLTHYGASTAVVNQSLTLGGAGGTIAVSSSNAVEFRGAINGPGSLRLENDSILLGGDSTYTGDTIVRGRSLTVEGGIAGSTRIDSTGAITLQRRANGPANQVADSAMLRLHGGKLIAFASDATPLVEQAGTLEISGAVNTVRFAGLNAPMSLQFEALQQTNGAGLFIDGANLGPGGNTLRINNAEALVVGGGATMTSRPIIPWAFAHLGGAGTVSNGSGRSSLVTETEGILRPLDFASEYAQSFAAALPADNVRITATQTVHPAGRRVNALLLANASITDGGISSTLTGGTITVTTGAILNTTRGNSVFNPIQFEAAEGVIISASTPGTGGDEGLTLWGPIYGQAGLTKLGGGNLLLAGTSFYQGATTLAGGRTTIIDDVLPKVPGPFGQGSQPIALVAGGALPGASEPSAQTQLFAQRTGGSLTIARPIVLKGATHASAVGARIETTTTGTLNLAGAIELQSSEAPLGVGKGNVLFWAQISGVGGFRDTGPATVTFAAASPGWTGAIELGLYGAESTIDIQAPTALGTGPIFVAPAAQTTLRGAAAVIGNPMTFAPSSGNSVLRFAGDIELAGTLDFSGSVGRPIAVAPAARVLITGGAERGSFRLLAGPFGSNATPGGTLEIASASRLDGRIFLGAASFAGVGPTSGAVLRITHPAGLGLAGVQIDTPGSMIQLDATASGGAMAIASGNFFVQGNGAGNRGAIDNASGNNRIDGDIVLLADTSIRVAGSSILRLAGGFDDVASPPSRLTKTGGGLLAIDAGQLNAATILRAPRPFGGISVNSGTVQFSSAAGPVWLAELEVAPLASLDLTNRWLVVDEQSIFTLSKLRALVASARNSGDWNGPGVTSSTLQNAPQESLAVVRRAVLVELPAAVFGLPLSLDAVIVAITLNGDADLDGSVDLDDFTALAGRFGSVGGWSEGDFDYNNAVNLSDFTLLAGNFGLSALPARRGAIPEPAFGLTASAFALAAVAQRRRHGR